MAEEVAAETWTTVVRGLKRFTGDETAWRAWVHHSSTTRGGRRLQRARRSRPRVVRQHVDVKHRAGQRRRGHRGGQHRGRPAPGPQLPAQAEVVLLRVVGLPVAEVAELLGRSPGAVRACHRGLENLARVLAKKAVTDSDLRSLRGDSEQRHANE